MRYRRIAAAALAAAAVTMAAGCGADDDPAATATDAYNAAGSLLAGFSIDTAVPLGSGGLTGTTHVRTGQRPASDTEFTASGGDSGSATELLRVDGVTYLRNGFGAKSWHRIDDLYREAMAPTQLALDKTPDLSSTAGELTDPLTYLRMIGQAVATGSVTSGEDGKTDKGAPATEYAVSCELRRPGVTGPACADATLATLAKPLGGNGKLDMDLYTDDDDRPMEITANIVLGNADSSRWLSLRVTLTITDYGEQHTFTAPSRDDTITCHRQGQNILCD